MHILANVHWRRQLWGTGTRVSPRLPSIGVRARRLGEGLQPPESGKAIIFRANAKFFGQKPAATNEKSIY